MAKKSNLAMMLGTTFLVASTAFSPAHADTNKSVAAPATIEAPAQPAHAALVGDHGDQKASPMAKRLGLIGLAGGILAVLVKLVGMNKIMRVIKGSARKATNPFKVKNANPRQCKEK